MGLSRGKAHIINFANLSDIEIAYVCDVDQNRLAAGAKLAADRQNGKAPQAVTDFEAHPGRQRCRYPIDRRAEFLARARHDPRL